MFKIICKSFLLRTLTRSENKMFTAANEPILEYKLGSNERIKLDEKIAEYNSKIFDVPIVIGGSEIKTNQVMHQVKPFDHQSKLAKYYYADKDTINNAIAASQKAFPLWDATPLESRAKIFERAAQLIKGKYRADLLAATMLGQGKTIVQAEIDAACELYDFFAFNIEWAFNSRNWHPIDTPNVKNSLEWRGFEGFWAAISPFNFTAIGGHLAGAPALMGNVVLWKPSDTAILSSYLVFKILKEAGLPDGVINFVPCEGNIFGDVITKSSDLAGVNFTGSAKTFEHIWSEVGKNISNYKSFPRMIGECGGKNFHLIHKSSKDIVGHIVASTVRSAFEYAGQKCSACSRIYLPRSLWNDISTGLVTEMKKIKVGSPLDADTFFSAVIDDKSYGRIKAHLDRAKTCDNLKILFGGECNDRTGYYIHPTLIETKDPHDVLMREELFGPVLTAYIYDDEQNFTDVLNLINTTTRYALTGSIFANDKSAIEEAKTRLRHSCGNFYINDKCTGSVVSQQPFGGARKSGTNDKAGSPFYILKFANLLSVKEQRAISDEWTYPYMRE